MIIEQKLTNYLNFLVQEHKGYLEQPRKNPYIEYLRTILAPHFGQVLYEAILSISAKEWLFVILFLFNLQSLHCLPYPDFNDSSRNSDISLASLHFSHILYVQSSNPQSK